MNATGPAVVRQLWCSAAISTRWNTRGGMVCRAIARLLYYARVNTLVTHLHPIHLHGASGRVKTPCSSSGWRRRRRRRWAGSVCFKLARRGMDRPHPRPLVIAQRKLTNGGVGACRLAGKETALAGKPCRGLIGYLASTEAFGRLTRVMRKRGGPLARRSSVWRLLFPRAGTKREVNCSSNKLNCVDHCASYRVMRPAGVPGKAL